MTDIVDRWPRNGDEMIFLGKNGYPFELKEAMEIFKVGEPYTVEDCNVQSWSHSIKFAGIKGRFNGVMFALPAPPQRNEVTK